MEKRETRGEATVPPLIQLFRRNRQASFSVRQRYGTTQPQLKNTPAASINRVRLLKIPFYRRSPFDSNPLHCRLQREEATTGYLPRVPDRAEGLDCEDAGGANFGSSMVPVKRKIGGDVASSKIDGRMRRLRA